MSLNYDLELDKVVSEVVGARAKVVGLQFPEGLKEHAVEVASEVESRTQAKVVVFIDPSYGACDLKKEQVMALGLDLLVHFGHTKFG